MTESRAPMDNGGPTSRFVVSRRRTGLGDCLVSLSSAWHYAKRTGRTLVIDWRYSRYARDHRKNAFSLLFEPASMIAGVPVICDDSVNGLRLPHPIHHGLGTGIAAKQLVFAVASKCGLLRFRPMHDRYERILDQAQRRELETLHSGSDRVEPTVVFERCLPEIGPTRRDDAAFLAGIRPRADIRDEMDRFERAHFTGRRVIGLHIRHGNGGYVGNHGKYWIDERETLRKICRSVATAETGLGDAIVFVCTDSVDVLEAVRSSLANVVARDKYFRPSGAGELHSFEAVGESADRDLGKDALIEMFLLARCQTLICYPPDSYFTFYARRIGVGMKLTVAVEEGADGDLVPISEHLC